MFLVPSHAPSFRDELKSPGLGLLALPASANKLSLHVCVFLTTTISWCTDEWLVSQSGNPTTREILGVWDRPEDACLHNASSLK